jgi:hypothetical protein
VNDLIEKIRHEAAALYRFVESVVRVCSDTQNRNFPAYIEPSNKFFRHVQLLGQETQLYLCALPEDAAVNALTAHSKRQKLGTLRASWETLHEYVKPTLPDIPEQVSEERLLQCFWEIT